MMQLDGIFGNTPTITYTNEVADDDDVRNLIHSQPLPLNLNAISEDNVQNLVDNNQRPSPEQVIIDIYAPLSPSPAELDFNATTNQSYNSSNSSSNSFNDNETPQPQFNQINVPIPDYQTQPAQPVNMYTATPPPPPPPKLNIDDFLQLNPEEEDIKNYLRLEFNEIVSEYLYTPISIRVITSCERVETSCERVEKCTELYDKELIISTIVEKIQLTRAERKNKRNKIVVSNDISVKDLIRHEINLSITLKCDYCNEIKLGTECYKYVNSHCTTCPIPHHHLYICKSCALNQKIKSGELDPWNEFKDDNTKKCEKCSKKGIIPFYKFIRYTEEQGYKMVSLCQDCSNYCSYRNAAKKQKRESEGEELNQHKRRKLN